MSHCGSFSQEPDWQFGPVIPADRRRALHFLADSGGRWTVPTAAFDPTGSDPPPDSQPLWAAVDAGGAMRAVVWLVPRPGRTAMIFLSRPPRRGLVGQVGRLVDAACDAMAGQGICLMQALLEQTDDLERAALVAGGFEELAWLEYLQRPIGRSHQPPTPPQGITFEPYSPERHADFLALLDASYEQTLDCPAICGRRRTEDTLAGHRATGRFREDLWTLLNVNGQPAGVMLLAEFPEQHLVELVYLGLAKRYRAQGLGRLLLERALHQCVTVHAGYLCTAVDRANEPARRLYRSMGFDRTACKLAMIRTLNEK